MITTISDSVLAGVTIEPAPNRKLVPVQVAVEGALMPIKHTLESFSWYHVQLAAKAVRAQYGFGNDAGNFIFDDDLDPDEEPFEGVRFADDVDVVVVSRAGLDALMARYFRALIDIADKRGLAVRDEAWWPEFLDDVAAIEQRATIP